MIQHDSSRDNRCEEDSHSLLFYSPRIIFCKISTSNHESSNGPCWHWHSPPRWNTGCTSFVGSSKGATDVYVVNKTSNRKKITVAVYDTDGGHKQIKKTLTIPSNQHRNPTRQDKIPWSGDYKVTVGIDSGPSKTDMWKDIHDALYISVTKDGLLFKTRKHPPSSWTNDT